MTTIKKPLKVLFVDILSELGGSEINLLNIVRQFSPDSIRPILACPDKGPLISRAREMGIEVAPIPMRGEACETNMLRGMQSRGLFKVLAKTVGELFRIVFSLRKIIRQTQPDVIYLNTLKSGILGGCASFFTGIPTVQHIQDILDENEFNPLLWSVLRGSLMIFPSRLIAISDAVRHSVMAMGINTKKIQTIYNGVDLDAFGVSENTDGVREKLGLALDRPVVGIIGRLMRWKGQHVFLRAAAEVSSDAQFVVIGGLFWESPEYADELKRLPRELNIEDKVIFTGHQDTIPEYITGLDIVVHASIKPEPFGLCIIEGMAAGKPVIGANAGGVPEIVVPGVTGLLVSPGSVQELAAAIEQLVADQQLRLTMGEAGRKRAEDYFSLKNNARNIEQLLVSMVSGRK